MLVLEPATPFLHLYLGDFATRLVEILPLRLLQEVGATGDGENDAVGHAVIKEAELHGHLKVAREQGLRDQTVHVWRAGKNPQILFHYKQYEF